MIPGHRTLFWAALVIPGQLVPCCFSSASVSRLQLLRGRPLFLFPCRFQVRAWRVVLDAGFLRVCPIQPHFFRSICLATGSCPARSHRSSFQKHRRTVRTFVELLEADTGVPRDCLLAVMDDRVGLRKRAMGGGRGSRLRFGLVVVVLSKDLMLIHSKSLECDK